MDEFFENIKEWILSGKEIPDDKKQIWNSDRCIENGICMHAIIDCPVCAEPVYRENVSLAELENALKTYNQNVKDGLKGLDRDKSARDTLYSWNKKHCKCNKYFCKCPVCFEHDLIKCPFEHQNKSDLFGK
jgi:hypothetical protein